MRLFALCVTLYACASVAVNNANEILNNIYLIGQYTTQLSDDVQRFTNVTTGIPYGLQVQQDAVNIHKQLLSTTALANSSDPFGEPSSMQVAMAITSLVSIVQAALQEVTSKAQAFDFLGPIVLASVYQLRNDAYSFGFAVETRLNASEAQMAPQNFARLSSAFNSAIKAYGGKVPQQSNDTSTTS